MKALYCATALAALWPAIGLAQDYSASGDKAAGERAFRQCQTCHVVQTPEGELLAGRGAKVGPNLYGVVGRQAGSVDGFRYSDAMVAAGEKGLKWNEAEFVPYVQDPTGYLRDYTGDKRARGKMAYKVRKEEDAINLYAYLLDLGPDLPEPSQAGDDAAASQSGEDAQQSAASSTEKNASSAREETADAGSSSAPLTPRMNKKKPVPTSALIDDSRGMENTGGGVMHNPSLADGTKTSIKQRRFGAVMAERASGGLRATPSTPENGDGDGDGDGDGETSSSSSSSSSKDRAKEAETAAKGSQTTSNQPDNTTVGTSSRAQITDVETPAPGSTPIERTNTATANASEGRANTPTGRSQGTTSSSVRGSENMNSAVADGIDRIQQAASAAIKDLIAAANAVKAQ